MRIALKFVTALAGIAALGLSACSADTDLPAIDTSIFGADDNWANVAGDWAESHYSQLTDISADNVGELGLAWEYDLGTARVQEATPLVIDGVMYTAGNLGKTYALNAATGEELWTFMPEVDMQVNRAACCDQANRGVAYADGKVFVAALDGHLYALNAEDGSVAWQADTIADRERGYTITGAPEIAGDLVVIGNAGAEYDVRGYVTAYDISGGEEAWRFWTIPHDPAEGPQESEALELAMETWDPNSRWDIGGGGTVWDAITYDAQFDQVILGVGNGGPYPQITRSPSGGDNLYLNSLVALDRESGEIKWHFQETPRDSWDLTATQPMVLTDMDIDGTGEKPVIIHAPKNGFYFLVDRTNGKPLVAEKLVRTSWADSWDLETGKPNLTPEYSDYSTEPKIVFPSSSGARNWHPGAYDPKRNLYFASVVDMGNLMFIPPAQKNPPHVKRGLNNGIALIFSADLEAAAASLSPAVQEKVKALPQWQQVLDTPYSSEIRGIDGASGTVKWAVDADGWQDRAGMLATQSGLLIHGTISGDLVIRNADNGEEMHRIKTGTSIMAAPMTYRVDGVQYVAVQAGWGGGGWGFTPPYSAAYSKGNANRLLVFKIGGGVTPIPDDLPPLEPAPPPPEQFADATPEMLALGSQIFTAHCSICHSNQARAPLPDLRRMEAGAHAAFDQIVLEGAFLPGGMPRWDDLISAEESKAIHAYLIDLQTSQRARELQLQAEGKPLDARALAIMSNF